MLMNYIGYRSSHSSRCYILYPIRDLVINQTFRPPSVKLRKSSAYTNCAGTRGCIDALSLHLQAYSIIFLLVSFNKNNTMLYLVTFYHWTRGYVYDLEIEYFIFLRRRSLKYQRWKKKNSSHRSIVRKVICVFVYSYSNSSQTLQ